MSCVTYQVSDVMCPVSIGKRHFRGVTDTYIYTHTDITNYKLNRMQWKIFASWSNQLEQIIVMSDHLTISKPTNIRIERARHNQIDPNQARKKQGIIGPLENIYFYVKIGKVQNCPSTSLQDIYICLKSLYTFIKLT